MAHILVVDDRPLNREVLVSLLGYCGHTLTEAADGLEALERVHERRPDLVITDLLMPNMDGEEFTRRLRADPATRELPVIFYTATYRVREARSLGARLGVKLVLPKPSEPAIILATVAGALGGPVPAAQPRVSEAKPAPGPQAAALERGIAERINNVQDLNQRLALLLESAMKVASEQATSLTEVRSLESVLHDVQSLGLRLAGMIELGIDLARVRKPGELIETFCRALQDLESTRYAGVVVGGGRGEPLHMFAARGLDDATRARVAETIANCPVARKLREPSDVARLVIGVKESDTTGLPAAHPPVGNFIACPLSAHGTAIGWLYVAERIGKSGFSTDDERLALALGSQFAIAWESLALYGEQERLVAERTRQLELSNRELESFSYSVSHDLRAPLRAIDGFTCIVQEEEGAKLAAEGQRHLALVREQTQTMAALIDDLLELARVGRRELGLRPVQLGELVRNCRRELAVEPAGRKVEWAIGELPVWNADPILLKQLVLNLLSNALKFTRRQAAARIEIGAERRGGEQLLFVRDNGAGFDSAQAEELFVAFKRLHAQEEYPGTGIGLAIVRRIAERHGARVWAEGTPGRGAAFYIAYPAAAE